MNGNALFIAATGQNVGKTTLCLGIQAALRKHFTSIGFIKPVGQQHVKIDTEGLLVDKDAYLFKELFQIPDPYRMMSPVIFPAGFTRQHLDGKTDVNLLKSQIISAFKHITSKHPLTIVEGTGHVGVGSLVGINNADVASMLGLKTIIISSGGLGSSFDELALNIEMCRNRDVEVIGVILNRVIEKKREMIMNYFPKALNRLGIPLLGCIPHSDLLCNPTMEDFETLFQTRLLAGKPSRYLHFKRMRLVAGSLESYLNDFQPSELVITPACRKDIIEAIFGGQILQTHPDYKVGVILTGHEPPSNTMHTLIQSTEIPCIYAPVCSYEAMKRITSFTAKICLKDERKISRAIELIEKHLELSFLIKKPACV